MRTLRAIGFTITVALVFAVSLSVRSGTEGFAGADPQASATPQASDDGRDRTAPGPRVVAVTPNPNEDCKSVTVVKQVYADRSDPTIANRSEASLLVVLGTVEGIEPGAWNTKSGERPDQLADVGPDNPDMGMIYRPVTIKTTEAIRGDAGAGLTVRWLGGQAGCEFAAIESGSQVDLKVGSEYAFFLGPSVEADGTYGSDLMILEAWPVDDEGQISTPLEGQVDVQEFSQSVAAAPELNIDLP